MRKERINPVRLAEGNCLIESSVYYSREEKILNACDLICFFSHSSQYRKRIPLRGLRALEYVKCLILTSSQVNLMAMPFFSHTGSFAYVATPVRRLTSRGKFSDQVENVDNHREAKLQSKAICMLPFPHGYYLSSQSSYGERLPIAKPGLPKVVDSWRGGVVTRC